MMLLLNTADVLTFVSIREVHTMATIDTGIANAPHTGFAGLSGVLLQTGASEIIECDAAFSSIQTRLYLQRETLRFFRFRHTFKTANKTGVLTVLSRVLWWIHFLHSAVLNSPLDTRPHK